MKKLLLVIICSLSFLPLMQAQRVGLVLSGGGAKGLTHIGVIRALEDSGIPIDYITGTSMGAIIGSLYAMGYSPDDMVELIASPDFKRWYTGQVEPDYMYFFKKNRPMPEFLTIRMSVKDSVKVKTQFLPTSVINPIQMNLAFLQKFAQATAYSRGDFDDLFVPFRCVASDVYNKRPVVFKHGDLGDAVRTSMSFPFVFKPIRVDGNLLYDGGIYNNFPVDVMTEDFGPEFILGSVVAKNPEEPEQDDLMSQIDNMVMQKTDYSIPDSLGIVLKFQYDDVSLMDMDRVYELQEIGYKETMLYLDSIKGRVDRRVDPESVSIRRKMFKSKLPEFKFRNIFIEGVNPQQKTYIRKEFQSSSDDELFTFEDLKRGYFRLLAGNMIQEIIPHAAYDPIEQVYDLYLNVRVQDNLALRIGGNISTTNANQIYAGVTYQDLNYYAKEFSFDGQLGKVYNNAQFMARIDLPTKIPTSYRLIASITSFDYYKNDKLFSKDYNPIFNSSNEYFIKAFMALPFLSNKRAEFSFGLARIEDKYYQSRVIDFEKDRQDKSSYRIFGGSVGVMSNTLDSKQNATEGYKENLIAQVYAGKEFYKPGNGSKEEKVHSQRSWLQIGYEREQYNNLTKKFVLGWQANALYSSKNFSQNYNATMMQAGAFTPTAHSKLVYNEAFRANQYFALGIKPIFLLGSLVHFRTELYGFFPVFTINKREDNKAFYSKPFSTAEFLGESSLVLKLPFGQVSAFVNYYSSPKKDWNVGLSIGWQLFNYRFIE